MSAQIPWPIGTIALAFALLASALGVSMPVNGALADDCLAAPNPATPPHSHWYFRTDRTQQRKCWHLQADNAPAQPDSVQTVSQAQAANPSQVVPTSGSYSFASFKEFMAQNGAAKLSEQDVKRLYAEFLEWKRHGDE